MSAKERLKAMSAAISVMEIELVEISRELLTSPYSTIHHVRDMGEIAESLQDLSGHVKCSRATGLVFQKYERMVLF